MKKHVILAAAFLLVNAFLYAELTRAQLWAISLTGILTEARGGYRNSLNDMAMTESGRNSALTTLRSSWGITTREELLETLDDLERGGHPDSFKEIKGIVYEVLKAGNNASAVQAIINSYQWDQVKWNRFRYVFQNWDKFERCTLWGWNLARSISLCRWGYNVGFMTESEAWKRIFHTAEILQQLFSSWEELGWDYFMGRLFWAASSGEEERYLRETEPIYNRLMNGYWGRLDWNVDLDAEEENVPLIPRSFSPPDDNDGTLRYLTNDSAIYGLTSRRDIANPNSNTYPNVYEMRVKKISGYDNSGFGMMFCFNNSDSSNIRYYGFFINVLGRFSVSKRTDNGWAPQPVSWRDSPYLNTGFGVYNTLRVERTDNFNGATFRVFINGNLAATFHDDDPINGSRFGPLASVAAMEWEQFPHIPVDIRYEYEQAAVDESQSNRNQQLF
jgi:hypothetical protein